MKRSKLLHIVGPAASMLTLAVTLVFAIPAGSALAAPADGIGLTAKIIAHSGQIITGDVNAATYDIGIYIGPGVTNVKVTGATIHGARYEGILVQEASDIVIAGNTVQGNGDPAAYLLNPALPPGPTNPMVVHEGKAIELAGTTDCLVKDNIVQNNNGDGGIGLTDYGPVFPALPFLGKPNTSATTVVASRGNLIIGNTVTNNWGGCGIVMSAWNPGAGIVQNVVSNNTLTGGVGGIIVAADLPNTTAVGNVALGNTVTGSAIMGIIVHSNAPGDVVSGTKIIGNTLSHDGFEEPPFDPTTPTGIAVVAEAPGLAVLTDTQVLSNTVSDETYGVWVYNATGTHIVNLRTSSVTNPISIKP